MAHAGRVRRTLPERFVLVQVGENLHHCVTLRSSPGGGFGRLCAPVSPTMALHGLILPGFHG